MCGENDFWKGVLSWLCCLLSICDANVFWQNYWSQDHTVSPKSSDISQLLAWNFNGVQDRVCHNQSLIGNQMWTFDLCWCRWPWTVKTMWIIPKLCSPSPFASKSGGHVPSSYGSVAHFLAMTWLSFEAVVWTHDKQGCEEQKRLWRRL